MSFIQLKVRSQLRLGTQEKNPLYHFFINNQVHELQIHDTCTITVQEKTLSRNAILGIDLFTVQCNELMQPCRTKAASDSVSLYSLHTYKKGQQLRCNLRNPNDPQTNKGFVILTIVDKDLSFVNTQDPPVHYDDIQRALNQTIRKSMCLFKAYGNGPLVPLIQGFNNVHAPVFHSRTGTLPGIAFWMGKGPIISEECLEHFLNIVCARLSISPSDVEHMSVVDAANVLAECCCAYPASLPYISDLIARGNQLLPFESFDDLFIRKAGDCEDFAGAICAIFQHIQETRDFKSKALQHLSNVAQHYLACSVLGAVARPSFHPHSSKHPTDADFAAHMYAKLIPLDVFYTCVGWPQNKNNITPPLETLKLKTYVCEGTGFVRCDFYQENQHETDLCYDCRGLPGNVQRMSCPDIHHCPFYKMDLHLYTNYFIQRNISNVGVFTCTKKGSNKFGVPFTSIMTDPTSITLHPHPALTEQDLRHISIHLQNEHPPARLEAPPNNPQAHVLVASKFCATMNYTDLFLTECTTFKTTIQPFMTRIGATQKTITTEQFTKDSPPVYRMRCYF